MQTKITKQRGVKVMKKMKVTILGFVIAGALSFGITSVSPQTNVAASSKDNTIQYMTHGDSNAPVVALMMSHGDSP
ncbi:TPA: Phr family secreted Rap phosphatase inhibitor [Bacillus cereus]|nr:Phr family secreted Rap phosphatase inhibitor [Bacillus cereus]HDR8014996.1 Phr family secreted Rap phosphatase inhibitor [Bacillus cereus]